MIKKIGESAVGIEQGRIVVRWQGVYRKARQNNISIAESDGLLLSRSGGSGGKVEVKYDILRSHLEDDWIVGVPQTRWDWIKHIALWVFCAVKGRLTGKIDTAIL